MGVALLAAALAAASCGGCAGGEFCRVNYETLYVAQPAAAVEKTLGPPTVRAGDTWTYVNDMPFYKAVIHFRDGRVVKKEWTYSRE
jgi:hypothetical protein